MASNLLLDDIKNESSDSDDADYVPGGDHDSGEESVAEDEIGTDEEVPENSAKSKVRSKRRSKKKKESPVTEPVLEIDLTDLTNECARKHADELYKKFLFDVENEDKLRSPSVSSTSGSQSLTSFSDSPATVGTEEDKSSPEYFEFAGEIIPIVKGSVVSAESPIPVASAGSPFEKKDEKKLDNKSVNEGASTSSSPAAPVVKRKGGLNAVLAIINKKQKLSTLQKSQYDWRQFKAMHGLTEELAQHTRGKDSYIQKKRFLERADLRSFEVEKNARLKRRK